MTNHNLFNPDKHILLNDRVLLKIQSVAEKSSGGILLCSKDTLKEQFKIKKGELISWSDGAFKDFKIKPEKGDTVFFTEYAGRIWYDENEAKYRKIEIRDLTGFERKE